MWAFFHPSYTVLKGNSVISKNNSSGYQSGKGSDLRQPFWSSSASMDWLQNICLSTASWRPAVHICDQPTHACCLFRAQGQPTVTGVLLSVDQSRGTVYLWHCVHVTSRRRLSEDIWRHFCSTLMTICYVDSYRDTDSYFTLLPSLLTWCICGPCELALYKCQWVSMLI